MLVRSQKTDDCHEVGMIKSVVDPDLDAVKSASICRIRIRMRFNKCKAKLYFYPKFLYNVQNIDNNGASDADEKDETIKNVNKSYGTYFSDFPTCVKFWVASRSASKRKVGPTTLHKKY